MTSNDPVTHFLMDFTENKEMYKQRHPEVKYNLVNLVVFLTNPEKIYTHKEMTLV